MSHQVESQEPAVGSVLADKYRIVKLLGRGGMGAVYEAEHVELGKRVALKFLHMTAQTDPTSLARFQQEARVICAVKSDHIVEVFDWGQDADGRPFLVMELLVGRDLGAYLKQQGKLEVAEAVRFAIEALRGLKRVHAAGIVHRDLKPENLFLVRGDDEQLHVKIVDFGLSKLMEGAGPVSEDFEQSARLTQQGALVGTPLYMSPEQIEAVDAIDQRTDIWAMGAILYEALTGSPPFMDRSYARLVMAICQRDAPDLQSRNPDAPAELAAAVAGALTRDRAERFQDTDQLAAALQGGLDAVQHRPPSTAAPGESDTVPSAPPNTPLPDTPVMAAPPSPRPAAVTPTAPSPGADAGALDATIAAHTRGAATVWLADVPAFSIWRGEVDSPDRLRIETRDGSVRDLRLEPVGPLNLGRVQQVKGELNDLVYPDVASRLAAKLRHDGVRWWLMRRQECSVPVQVGTRALQRGEEAPLVHGSFVTVGAMRATMVDRRYVSRSVPAGTVDPLSGLLGRGGLEQELATALQQGKAAALVMVYVAPERAKQEHPDSVRVAVALHQSWPSAVIARDGDIV
ncbi:MAG: serine/threonine protein kinase, partial [Deltaproteobacteria bacterium]|nr:serine/threonine protein kinase [Deltaproteobacteria bacterium]MBW2534960.1 serine/threonine protein kinase [Deltaproteobacteria bacterium]